MWRRTDHNRGIGQIDEYYSVAIANNGSILVAGSAALDRERGLDGVLVKIVPDVSPPRMVSFIPVQLEFSVLQADTVRFAVGAFDLQDDSLMFVWTVDEDSIASDTSTTIIFDDLGDFTVNCVVSDGELADSVHWLVHVEEFYIDSYSPDSIA